MLYVLITEVFIVSTTFSWVLSFSPPGSGAVKPGRCGGGVSRGSASGRRRPVRLELVPTGSVIDAVM
eukprot:5412523-Amphidinium_carterae.1